MRTLILFTSKYGCTAKASELLKSRIDGEVEVVNLQEINSPSIIPYDRIIMGTSIYFGKPRKEMTDFTRKFGTELNQKEIGLFICAGMEGEKAMQELKLAFPDELVQSALAMEVFGEENYPQKMSFPDKLVLRMVKGKGSVSRGLSIEAIDRFAKAMNEAGTTTKK